MAVVIISPGQVVANEGSVGCINKTQEGTDIATPESPKDVGGCEENGEM
jgi:hypothetical protein